MKLSFFTKSFFVAVPLFLFPLLAAGQTILPGKVLYYTTDELCHIYVTKPNFAVVKYTPDGKELYRYANTRLDEPTFTDATDPFNILLFYQEYQTVILLDRTMTETARLNFGDFDLFNVNAVGISSDNNLWVYDELNFRLKKMNRNGETIQESDDLGLLLNANIKPNFITERNQKVFVNDPDIGILVFDFFGQYIKTLDFKNLEEFQIFRDLLIFEDAERKTQTFHLKSLLTSPLPPTDEKLTFEKIRIQTGYLYGKNEEGIFILRL